MNGQDEYESGIARRDALFAYLVEYKENHGGATPRVRDMMAATGISATSVVHYHLRKMARDGRIRLIDDGGKVRHIAIPGEIWRVEGI